jgi:hypothetical protein
MQTPRNLKDSPNDSLLTVLSVIGELPQAVLVDVVDLFADGTSRQLGVVGGNHHSAMCFAAHDCSYSLGAVELVYMENDAMRSAASIGSLCVYLAWSASVVGAGAGAGASPQCAKWVSAAE